MVHNIYYQDMNIKPNQARLQEYNKALHELQILNPTSEFATFKQIYSDTSGSAQLPKDAKLYMKLRGKMVNKTPQIIKKVSKKSIRLTKSTLKRYKPNKPRYETLTNLEIDTRLKHSSTNAVVSIIIPVYNNIDYTKKCINSLAHHESHYGFEVVITDDQSTDQTQEYCKSLDNIAYIRNSKNLGFLLSCNAAAAKVKNRYTILLNNDTEVLPGWLDNLIGPLEEDKTIGLVGSKLIYPDGSLQEAGGIVFSDGNAWNYGKNSSPDDFEYNYVREVDYISGASIAFRTKTFKEFGGFDEQFAPAYYEDTDLAMQMRQNNLKVVYNPASSIIHYEGKSMGTDTGVGLKAYQKKNKEKFYKKWQEVLKVDHYEGPQDLLWARERNVSKHVLVCDIHVPFPDKDAGSVRMHAILTCLRELGYHVTFWSDTHCPIDKYTQDLQSEGIEVVYGGIAFEDFIINRTNYYDTSILSRPIVAPRYLPLTRLYSPQTQIIFDTVDLHYIRLSRQARVENNPDLANQANKWKIIELSLIEQSDAALVVSIFEKKELKKIIPKQRVEVISLIHELKTKPAQNFAKRKDLMFIGSYNHLPNKDGLNWFVNTIWPIVRKKQPNLQLNIIGSNIPDDLFKNDQKSGINVIGFIEDPSKYFESSRVFIAPLRFGAGIKGKILQSIEYGLPVVTTKVGAEGMFLKDNESAMIADEPNEIAAKIYDIYTHKQLWEKTSKSSQLVLVNHFSRKIAKRELAKLVE